MTAPGAEERFALSRIFAGDDEFSVAVRAGLADAEILARDETASGFVANVGFREPLPSVLKAKTWDWYFKHRSMPYGGCFIASFDSDVMLIVHAMSFYGDWPTFDPNAFAPLVSP